MFTVHPRTRKRIEEVPELKGLLREATQGVGKAGVYGIDPLGYLDFMATMAGARIILTDSGAFKKRTQPWVFHVLPCEKIPNDPSRLHMEQNRLVGCSPETIVREARQALSKVPSRGSAPPLWDGKASEQIVEVLRRGGIGRNNPQASCSKPGLS